MKITKFIPIYTALFLSLTGHAFELQMQCDKSLNLVECATKIDKALASINCELENDDHDCFYSADNETPFCVMSYVNCANRRSEQFKKWCPAGLTEVNVPRKFDISNGNIVSILFPVKSRVICVEK